MQTGYYNLGLSPPSFGPELPRQVKITVFYAVVAYGMSNNERLVFRILGRIWTWELQVSLLSS